MAGFKVPVFESGTVLTQEMLELLKNYAIDLGTLHYAGYSDGIICGCGVTMSGTILSVNRGIIMFAGNLYFLPQEMKVMVNSGDDWQVLRLIVGNMSRDQNFMIGELQLELTSDITEDSNKIEICRFRLQNGAMLRNKYRNFNDLNTEFDTVNEIYAKWSGYQNKSISNRILVEFAKEARKKNTQNPQDIMLIQQILALDGKTMNREVILYYLSVRLNRKYQEMSNEEIYKALCEVLTSCRPGADMQRAHAREQRRIIVD